MSKGDTIIKVEDRTNIACVKFKFPELMNEQADEKVRDAYYAFLDADDALHEARERVYELEKQYEKAKKKWDEMKNVVEVEFEVVEKEISAPKSTTLTFKGMGNSTLGFSTQ